MCEECLQSPCNSRCPNAPEPRYEPEVKVKCAGYGCDDEGSYKYGYDSYCRECWTEAVVDCENTPETELEFIRRNEDSFFDFLYELEKSGTIMVVGFRARNFEAMPEEFKRIVTQEYCFGEDSDRMYYAEFLMSLKEAA